MIIISGRDGKKRSEKIANELFAGYIEADIRSFNDQELCVRIRGSVRGEDVIIIQSTSKPVNDNLMKLLLLIDAARRAGAGRITAVISYFGYGRQDRMVHSGAAISASLIASMLESAGANEVITIDLHSKRIEEFFKIKVQNLDGVQLFKPSFQDNRDLMVISPDIGGIDRAKSFSKFIGCDIAVINKSRDHMGVCQAEEITGDVKDKHCIIVDDIIDTGATICRAAELLMRKGALSVEAYITHAVLSERAVSSVESSAIRKIYISDSIPHEELPRKIEVVSLDRILIDVLRR